MDYTKGEKVWYYVKRTLINVVPLLVALPLASWCNQPWIVAIIIPLIHNVDKFLRNSGLYKNKLALF